MRAVNCVHASPAGMGVSSCALGLFNGAPTFGQCVNYCDRREPRPGFVEPPREVPATRGVEDKASLDTYRALWRELHTKVDADEAWLDGFTARIPCGSCREEWRAMLSRTPPVFGEGWFEWGVDRHNEVNKKLGKPLLPLPAASSTWRAT